MHNLWQSILRLLQQTRHVDIRIKILLPSLLLLILPYVTIVLLNNKQYYTNQQAQISSHVNARGEQIQRQLNKLAQNAYELSAMLSALPQVQEAFQAYYNDTISDLESSMMLQYSLNDYFGQIKRDYDLQYRFQFYIPPATAFMRSWNNDRLDDLSFLRQSVLDVMKTKNPIRGIEVGLTGMEIRGITPVYSAREGTFLGAVETLIPLGALLDNTPLQNKEELALYVSSEQLNLSDIGETLVDESSNQQSTRQFNLLNYSSQNFQFDFITNQRLRNFINSEATEKYQRSGDYVLALYKLTSYQNEPIGVIAYQWKIDQLNQDMEYLRLSEFLVLLAFLIIGTLVMVFVVTIILRPIHHLTAFTDQLNTGSLAHAPSIPFRDQIGKLSQKLVHHVSHLRALKDFIHHIHQEQFDQPSPAKGKNDALGNALQDLRDKLKQKNKEETLQRDELDKRNWVNEGKSKINELVRQRHDSVRTLSDAAVRLLVNYLDANQAGLFIVLENEETHKKHLELRAMYAYGHRKHERANLAMGEGLVGMAAQDNILLYRTDIPEHFVRIRSGLGEAPPTTLIVVPFTVEDKVIAVLEMASFNTYEEHHLEFLSAAGETIGSAIANIYSARRTNELLKQSRQQAQELSKKETEMRDNLDKLQETQKEARRTEERALGTVNAFNSVIMRANFQKDGTISYANSLFLEKMKYLETEIEGFTIDNFLEASLSDAEFATFKEQWQHLVTTGESFEHDKLYTARNDEIWIHGIFSAIQNDDGQTEDILFIGFDIHQQKSTNILFEQEAATMAKAIMKTLYKTDGTVISDNAQFFDIMGFERHTEENQNIFDFMTDAESRHYRSIWNRVLKGEHVENLEQLFTKEGEPVWLKGVYAPVYGKKEQIDRIMFLAIDVTQLVKDSNKDYSID